VEIAVPIFRRAASYLCYDAFSLRGADRNVLKRFSLIRRTNVLRALTVFACFACGAAIMALPGQNHWTLEATMKQLDQEARNFHSLTADIERTKVTVVVNDKSTESGKLFVRRDDKMRIEFAEPDAKTLLRSGNELLLFNPKIKQVEEYDLSKHRALVDQFLLLGFGTSGTDLQKGYLVTFVGEEEMDKRQVVKLELTPKSDEARKEISKIHIWIDESTWLPAQQQLFETGSGDYFIIRYTNVVRNPKLSDNEFKPHWPKGVTHVKPQG
jgi:outer membrane lipoprotein-sorting protein